MRMLKRLRNDAIALVVLCAAGYVAYQVLLDDEAKEGVPFESLPEDWVCPLCKHPKSDFVLQG